ncbi:MAG: ABC transporter permease [Phycisphaerales bacterium]
MSESPHVISGIEAMRGVGQQRALGFWADAWQRVLQRPSAVLALMWIGLVAAGAVLAPVLANAHPLVMESIGPDGEVLARSWPLWDNLRATDLLLLLGALAAGPWLAPTRLARLTRGPRLGLLAIAFVQVTLTVLVVSVLHDWLDGSGRSAAIRGWGRSDAAPWVVSGVVAAVLAAVASMLPSVDRAGLRLAVAMVAAAAATWCLAGRWQGRLVNFDRYTQMEAEGTVRATYTLIPWSPDYARSDMGLARPGMTAGERIEGERDTPLGRRRLWLGSDALGGDVLSQMLWACRLSISIGLVSTGISLLIGVTIGSIMGYFGGKIDMLLFRVVEIFMAIPVLFLLIVAAGVLPRNTYVMMALIGCFSWTGAARFTRAEFLKLRRQDFVQSAQSVGLPLRMILFRHMLPNGITPVLVDASFAVAAAIAVEATLSFLGLGPDGQASWGKLLSSATASTGTFVWWLAIFPGGAIFLSVLAYNMLGESLRDAIDPKLRKAAQG